MIGQSWGQSQLFGGYTQSRLGLLIPVISNCGKNASRSPSVLSRAIYLVSSYTEANLKAFITHTSLVDLLFTRSPGEAQ